MRRFLILLFVAFSNPKILGFPFSTKNSLTWGLKCEIKLENREKFIRCATKIVHKWNSHLEIFSLPQAIENVRQFFLLRTDILQKTVDGCPCNRLTVTLLEF